MFNLFGKKENTPPPEWVATINETQQRWFTFLEKLEAKMDELCTAAIPELEAILSADDEDGTFYKIQSGINGQMRNIHSKAYDTYDAKVLAVYYEYRNMASSLDAHYDILENFRDKCSDRYQRDFDKKYNYWMDALASAAVPDYEILYQEILEEFDKTKNNFSCSQCGSPVTIDRIFFISRYISCPACNTQNTFEPGSSARKLQNIARGLAEQRTKHLLLACEKEQALQQELYHQNHELKLSSHFEKDKTAAAAKNQQIQQNEARRQEAVAMTPQMYKTYLRAMYDEWNCITPDLKEHNERMYLKHVEANYFSS